MKKPPVVKADPILASRLLHAFAALFVLAWLVGAAWYGYDAVTSHPIHKVVFAGPTARISAFDLDALARGIQSAPERPSLAEVREAARRIRWVRDASARRVSADTIEIRFDTHEPLARWNDDALVSRRGEVFVAEADEPLPVFRGADGTAPLIARQYPVVANAVAPLGSPLKELRLTARGAWQATLASGLVLDLGRSDLEARIARFAAAWPELEARLGLPPTGTGSNVPPLHADLRYPNGFALRKTAEKDKKKAT